MPGSTFSGAIETGDKASSGLISFKIAGDGASITDVNITLTELNCDGLSLGRIHDSLGFLAIPLKEGEFNGATPALGRGQMSESTNYKLDNPPSAFPTVESLYKVGQLEGKFSSSTQASGTIKIHVWVMMTEDRACELGTFPWKAELTVPSSLPPVEATPAPELPPTEKPAPPPTVEPALPPIPEIFPRTNQAECGWQQQILGSWSRKMEDQSTETVTFKPDNSLFFTSVEKPNQIRVGTYICEQGGTLKLFTQSYVGDKPDWQIILGRIEISFPAPDTLRMDVKVSNEVWTYARVK